MSSIATNIPEVAASLHPYFSLLCPLPKLIQRLDGEKLTIDYEHTIISFPESFQTQYSVPAKITQIFQSMKFPAPKLVYSSKPQPHDFSFLISYEIVSEFSYTQFGDVNVQNLENNNTKIKSKQPMTSDVLEDYIISFRSSGHMKVQAKSEQGLYRASQTIVQIIILFQPTAENSVFKLHPINIYDSPDLKSRCYMVDVSRNRIPTIQQLEKLIDSLAFFKYNELQLYIEHTFAYEQHEEVWKGYSPLTGAEIRHIDQYCKERFIELIPNQNCLGHFHKWLRHEKYRELAEVPEGLWHPFSPEKEPFSLCATDPKAFQLVIDLFTELLPNFTSKKVNVNLDESFDLGRSRSKKEMKKLGGKGHLYLKYLLQLHQKLTEMGYEMMCWGDAMHAHPEIISKLPPKLTVLEWGYEKNHKFDKYCKKLHKANVSFYVCPGTSSWTSISGRTTNAIENIGSATKNGVNFGASGMLLADWGDGGHIQAPFISYVGILTAATMSWNVSVAKSLSDPETSFTERILSYQLDKYIFRDTSAHMGALVCEIGNIYQEIGVQPENSSLLFWSFQLPMSFVDNYLIRAAGDMFLGFDLTKITKHVGHIGAGLLTGSFKIKKDKFTLASEHLKDIVERFHRYVKMEIEDSEIVKQEFLWTAELSIWACDLWVERIKIGIENGVDKIENEKRIELADRLNNILDTYRKLWKERSREGGLDASCSTLELCLKMLKNGPEINK